MLFAAAVGGRDRSLPLRIRRLITNRGWVSGWGRIASRSGVGGLSLIDSLLGRINHLRLAAGRGRVLTAVALAPVTAPCQSHRNRHNDPLPDSLAWHDSASWLIPVLRFA